MKNETTEQETERRGTSALTRLLGTRLAKYRAWIPGKGIMRPVTRINFGDEGEALTITFEVTSESKFHNIFVHGENGYLLEFTGLKDKNDREIYEGDIIKAWDWGIDENFEPVKDESSFDIALVYFYKEDGGYALKSKFKNINTDFLAYCSKTEIIGNAFENPELLDECT